MSDDMHTLARQFIADCKGAGHLPYVAQTGRFGLQLGVALRTAPEPEHHLGPDRAYTLGFDDRPYVELLKTQEGLAALVDVLTAEAAQ